MHKGDKKVVVEIYRSISLLPIPAKCLERLVYDATFDHIFPHLTEWHHGYVKGGSCVTQLILTIITGQLLLMMGVKWTLPFSKAFDRVSHSVLLKRLCSFGVSGRLLRWCESYLTDRRQRVLIDGVSSSWSDVCSGVPQDSLLGPLFFIIFISELPSVVLPVTPLHYMQMTVKAQESSILLTTLEYFSKILRTLKDGVR